VDLKKANAQQLLDFGLPLGHIDVSPYCTVAHNDRFFSHRLEKGVTGRMMAVIGMNV
jgi:copper oxidase (laccase) domain-containing protein